VIHSIIVLLALLPQQAVKAPYAKRHEPDAIPQQPVVLKAPMVTANASAFISGLASGSATSVEVITSVGSSNAPVFPLSGRFKVSVPLKANAVNKAHVYAVSPDGARSAPAVAHIVQDGQAPSVHIDSPVDGAVLRTVAGAATTSVSGRIADTLSGFVGLTVTVNAVPAQTTIGIGTNGTFFLPSVPLAVDADTTITVVATDTVGNSATAAATIKHETIPSNVPRLQLTSGDGQQAVVESTLTQPIRVRVLTASGTGFSNKLVNFRVTRSNGLLTSTPSGGGTRLYQARTDFSGFVQAYWTLGSDAGSGNQRVHVSSAGIEGQVVFSASATPGPALQINISSGNNQRSEIGAVAPEALRVFVHDGCNGVSAVPVVFTSEAGGALVGGQSSAVVYTGLTGHAELPVTLGPMPGRNEVAVTFSGNPSAEAVFSALGVARDPGSYTLFRGLVLDNSEQPLRGATCTLELENGQVLETTTEVDGTFEISNAGEGTALLHIDGATVFQAGGATGGVGIPPGTYPSLEFEVLLVEGAANSLPGPILLPPLDPDNWGTYSTTTETVLAVAGIAGLEMRIAPGSMTIDGVPAADGMPVALNRVNFDDVPMPMPDGAAPPFAWTLQPSGAHFDPPVSITYPNLSGLPPGSATYFLSFDHDTAKFEIVATGQVNEEGSLISTDPGSGISVAGWGCNCPPYSVTGSCTSCHVTIEGGTDALVVGETRDLLAVGMPSAASFSYAWNVDPPGAIRGIIMGANNEILRVKGLTPSSSLEDVTVTLTYAVNGVSCDAKKNFTVYDVTEVEWLGYDPGDGSTNLVAGGSPNEMRLFAERNQPLGRMDDELHNRVQIKVTLNLAPPSGTNLVVYGKIFDPDHFSSDSDFDPPGAGGIEHDDNIAGFGVHSLGGILKTGDFSQIVNSVTLVGNGVDNEALLGLELFDRQPANNYIVAAHLLEPYIADIVFDTPGVVLKETTPTGTDVPTEYQTELLTIWRTVYAELDSMGTPDHSVGPGPGLVQSANVTSIMGMDFAHDFSLDVAGENGQFENGKVDLLDSGQVSLGTFDITGDDHSMSKVTISQNVPASTATLENMEDDDIAGGNTAQDMVIDTSRWTSILEMACILPNFTKKDLSPGDTNSVEQNDVAFTSNVTLGDPASSPALVESDVRAAIDTNKQSESTYDFWVVYQLGVHQITPWFDNDPGSEAEVYGITFDRDMNEDEDVGVVVAAEVVRDGVTQTSVLISESEFKAITSIHELLHLFRLRDINSVQGIDDGPIMDFDAIKDADTQAKVDALVPNGSALRKITETPRPGDPD